MADAVRTRIAPSPTGDPHVGTAYVALFNYALARKTGGQFVLRVEDTDRQRSSVESERMIFEALRWLGLDWDEGPDVGGPHGPYRQSERTEIYREHAERLVASGHAYPCFCTAERLEALRAEQKAAKARLGYDRLCRGLDSEEAARRAAAGEPHVIRLALPTEGEIVVHDLLRREISFAAEQVDDQVLVKSDGHPTYHLANVVDDHLMGITHVIRAEEWISSLPKHHQLYRAFGWSEPVFCHLPLLRNADTSKISKRKNPVSLNYFRRAGILPEALLNYLALMGWAMPDERDQFGLDEFVAAFDLATISLGGPVFDLDKLIWLNGKHVRALSAEELLARLRSDLLGDPYLLEVVKLAHERVETLADFVPYAEFFFSGDLGWDEAAAAKMVARDHTPPQTAKLFRLLLEESLDPMLEWTAEALETALREFCERHEVSPKALFMPIRVAVTGRPATPPLFDTMAVLGKEICRRRLRLAVELLRTMKG
ncbi:MAG TPA: glutamate--tRNA ligase [Methylomirabilota bacterium]|nr:glutamate--tRNA ligase [Methylomirabilota bacterium]